jgi:hypothetical protein
LQLEVDAHPVAPLRRADRSEEVTEVVFAAPLAQQRRRRLTTLGEQGGEVVLEGGLLRFAQPLKQVPPEPVGDDLVIHRSEAGGARSAE